MNTQLERTYDSCIIRGQIIENIAEKNNFDVIKQKIEQTKIELQEIKTQKTKTSEQKTQQFNKYYDALTILKNLFLQKNNVKIEEEQCKNAYLCVKFPFLELNFEFLENTRNKFEAQKEINEEWTMMKIHFELHIQSLLNNFQTK